MRKSFQTAGPYGTLVTAQQLEQGEITKAGDWFIVFGHCRQDWYAAEPNMRVREFHHPHVRIIKEPNPITPNHVNAKLFA